MQEAYSTTSILFPPFLTPPQVLSNSYQKLLHLASGQLKAEEASLSLKNEAKRIDVI